MRNPSKTTALIIGVVGMIAVIAIFIFTWNSNLGGIGFLPIIILCGLLGGGVGFSLPLIIKGITGKTPLERKELQQKNN
ncbi:MAG: hypothetical protein ACR2J3_10160 [Aridibacter sp.]